MSDSIECDRRTPINARIGAYMRVHLVGKRIEGAADLWRRDERSVVVWRAAVDPHTFKGYYSHFYRFLEGLGKTPGEFLVWARDPDNTDACLDAIKSFVMGIDRRAKAKMIASSAIRSFLMHNRVQLPPDATLHFRSNQPPSERKLTIPQIRELIGLAVQPWRSMLLMKWGSLCDNQGLIDISNNHAETLTKALDEKAEICKLTMPGRKNKRNIEGS